MVVQLCRFVAAALRLGLRLLVLLVGVAADAHAAPRAEQVAQAEPRAGTQPASQGSLLARWWQHTSPLPLLFYSPETQLGFGAGLMTTWSMPRSEPERPSSVVAYGIYTTRRQTFLGLSQELRFAEDRYVLLQELRYVDWPDRYYGVGNFSRESAREDYIDRYWQLETEGQVRVIGRLYAGLRHHLRGSDTLDLERGGVLAEQRPRGTGPTLWSGLGPTLQWDTRDGLFWPTRGDLLRAEATYYQPGLGADFTASVYRLDLRHYQPLWRDHVLALRFVSMAVTGEPPFQRLPALGGAALFRGWYLGRLRDRALLSVEAEYRLPLSERWALVSFASLGRVASRVAKLAPSGLHAAGGAGVRFAVKPDSRANVRFDVAYGDELYIYFQFREAF